MSLSLPDLPADSPKSDIPTQYDLTHYQYDLPPRLIGQAPRPDRAGSRLLSMDIGTGSLGRHRFRDLPDLLEAGDLLVVNATKVVKALLPCRKVTGGKIDLLVLDPALSTSCDDGPTCVKTCLAQTRKMKAGAELAVDNGPILQVLEILGEGKARVLFPTPHSEMIDFLATYGKTPLPPYIKPGSRDEHLDSVGYQTVYSRTPGSVAAPTAGLHFTDVLLKQLEDKGVELAKITLHVGPGTFIPVKSRDIREHRMQSESYEITEETAAALNSAKRRGRRIIAVGTTTLRTLETAVDSNGMIKAGPGESRLYVYPGYQFRFVENMITNFHLPGSTLFMLVCALAGVDLIKKAYKTAVEEEYMFYSYGDACLILK
jgi:S-adenosylmethionine:tRNA ribosyltransferase-isomerase